MMHFLGTPKEIFWESPVKWSWTNEIQQPADKENYLQLLTELKIAFKPGTFILPV